MTISFDVWDSETPRFEIYGTDGTICIPDPEVHGANDFHGPFGIGQEKKAVGNFNLAQQIDLKTG